MELDALLSPIRPLDEAAMARCRARWDAIAKPLDGLGALERDVVRIAGMTGEEDVRLDRRLVLTLCADNGVVAEGVTQTGAEVTRVVAYNLADGRGNVNAMARAARCDVRAVDMGMNAPVAHPALIDRRVAAGTGNIAQGPAMTRAQAIQAVTAGVELAREAADAGYQVLLTGEMGIGNTTTASAVAAALLGVAPRKVTGRGAGLSDEGLARKVRAIERALEINAPDPEDPLDCLGKLGGFDIAGMAGLFLGGALARVPVLADGAISLVAALAAARLHPLSRNYMLASHISREPVARMLLEALDLDALICAGLALGEGTGAVAALPLLDMALCVYRQESTFDQSGIEAYQRFDAKQ